MIYLITAIYAEAHPFITRFELKKDSSHTRFQVFRNAEADLCLVISGTGAVPAATAVSSICTEYNAGPGDFLLNVGICAQISTNSTPGHEAKSTNACRTGALFLCNKIKEQVTGRTFYPDILYRHTFAEAQILTGARPYQAASLPPGLPDNRTKDAGFFLYDMEAAAVYQAGAYYFGPHQMSFLKVISDTGNTGQVTSELVEQLLCQNMDAIADYIATLQTASQESGKDEHPIHKSALPREADQLCLDLHCSRTMAESVRQHIRYWTLAGMDYLTVLEEMYLEGRLPCKDKREGKQRFEELKARLL